MDEFTSFEELNSRKAELLRLKEQHHRDYISQSKSLEEAKDYFFEKCRRMELIADSPDVLSDSRLMSFYEDVAYKSKKSILELEDYSLNINYETRRRNEKIDDEINFLDKKITKLQNKDSKGDKE